MEQPSSPAVIRSNNENHYKDRREAIVKALKADPSKTDNQIAKTLGVTHPTVAAVRANSKIYYKDRREASGHKQDR